MILSLPSSARSPANKNSKGQFVRAHGLHGSCLTKLSSIITIFDSAYTHTISLSDPDIGLLYPKEAHHDFIEEYIGD